jgi:hypothetical protein
MGHVNGGSGRAYPDVLHPGVERGLRLLLFFSLRYIRSLGPTFKGAAERHREASYLAHGQEIAMLVYMGHDLLVKHGGDLKQLLDGISVSSVKLFRIELYSGLTHHHL